MRQRSVRSRARGRELLARVARLEARRLRIADLVAEVHAVEEQREDERRRPASTFRSPARNRAAASTKTPPALDADAERQAAADRHQVQQHVARFAHAVRDEPLEPLFQRPDDHARPRPAARQSTRPAGGAPGAIEEEADEAVFEKWTRSTASTSGVPEAVARLYAAPTATAPRMRRIAGRPPIADPHQRDGHRDHNRRPDAAGDDRREMARETPTAASRGPDP